VILLCRLTSAAFTINSSRPTLIINEHPLHFLLLEKLRKCQNTLICSDNSMISNLKKRTKMINNKKNIFSRNQCIFFLPIFCQSFDFFSLRNIHTSVNPILGSFLRSGFLPLLRIFFEKSPTLRTWQNGKQ
jgi:hypothetical protein